MSSKPPFDWPGLQVAEHYDAQRRGWRVDRAGWIVMLLVVLGALLGLFGNGSLGLATAADEAGILEVEYNRFARYGADLTLTVQVREEAATQGGFEVWVATDYLEGVRIDDVSPAPDTSEASSGGVLYTFLADQGDLEAVFDLTGDNIGLLDGSVGLGGPDGAVTFSQFFYP